MEYDVRVYRAGARVAVPRDWLEGADCEILERGGCGQGTLRLEASWEDAATLQGGEIVDLLLGDEVVYRGHVEIAERALAETEHAQPTLYGLVEILNSWYVERKYAYSTAQDIATIFGQMMYDHLTLKGRLSEPGHTIEATSSIGVYLKEFDARGSTLAEAANMLLDSAPALAIWGCEVKQDDLTDLIYIRPRSTAIARKFAIGGNVAGYVQPKDLTEIVNRMRLTGGPVANPNLCPNPSFEEPTPYSETVGNLLGDYSFEDGAGIWDASGSRKVAGQDGTALGAPRTGTSWLELDTSGEYAQQTVPIDYQTSYQAWAWARREDTGTARQVRLIVQGLDAGGTPQVTYTGDWFDPGDSGIYQRFFADPDAQALTFSLFPTVTQARFRVETNGGTASNDGVLVDDCTFIEAFSVGQDGWRSAVGGDGRFVTLDWVNKRGSAPDDFDAFHGGYCVKMEAADISGGGDYVEVRLTRDSRVSVQPGQTYQFGLRFRSVAGFSYSLGLAQYRANGSAGAAGEIGPVSVVAAPDWTWSALLEWTMATDTASAELFFRLRTNGVPVWIDACWFGIGSMPYDVYYNGDYWPGDTYERVVDVTSGDLGLDAAAETSITDWGEREREVTNENVTDFASFVAFAEGYFNARAVPAYDAQLRVRGVEEPLAMTGRVELVGLPLAHRAQQLFPARIQYSIGPESIDMTVDMGSERPDSANLFSLLRQREIAPLSTVRSTIRETTRTAVITVPGDPINLSGYRWAPLSNGDPDAPELIWDAEGEVIMVLEPIP